MDNLQQAELYLTQADQVLSMELDGEPALCIVFADTSHREFMDTAGFLSLTDFFSASRIKLAIRLHANYYRCALVNTETGDTINLDGVLWSEEAFEEFKSTIAPDSRIRLYITLADLVQKELLRHEWSNTHVMYVEGYVLKEERAIEEDAPAK